MSNLKDVLPHYKFWLPLQLICFNDIFGLYAIYYIFFSFNVKMEKSFYAICDARRAALRF